MVSWGSPILRNHHINYVLHFVMEVDGSASKFLATDQACPEVTRWVAKLASAMQKTRMAVWNLAPGCARWHQGMIQRKKQRKFWKSDVQCFQNLWLLLLSCKILYNESNNHISFQCSTRQTACGWHPTDGMRRPCGMVKSCHEFGRWGEDPATPRAIFIYILMFF
jgi:hypothetical protein